eukprot:762790-Hanusia_phi.AAC.2
MSYLRYESYYGASRPQAPTPIGGASPPEERYQSYQMQYQVQPQPEATQFQAFQYQPQVRQFTSPSFMQPQPVQVSRSQPYGYADRMGSYPSGNFSYDRQVPVSQMPVPQAAPPVQQPVNAQSSYVRKDEGALSFERPNIIMPPQPSIHMNQPSYVPQSRNDDLYSSQDRRAAQESGSYRLVSREEAFRQGDPVQASERSNLFGSSGAHDRLNVFSPSGENRNNGMGTPVQGEMHNDDRVGLRQYDRQRDYSQADLVGRRPSEDKKQTIYGRPMNSAPSPAHERHLEINRMAANATPTNVIPPSASPLPSSAASSTGLVGIGIVFQQKNDGRMYIKSLIEGEAASLADPRPMEGDCIIGVDGTCLVICASLSSLL